MSTEAIRVIDSVRDLSDWDQESFSDGQLARWDAASGKFIGATYDNVNDKTYSHIQSTPATTWVIAHNLGKYASVTVIDAGGDIVIGDVSYDDLNTVTLTFSAAISGQAYLN